MQLALNYLDENHLYGKIREVFARYPDAAIDLQGETVDVIQVVRAIQGIKTTFLGIAAEDDERAGPYNEVVSVAKSYGCFSGSGSVNVHHRYRSLKIDNRRLALEIEGRNFAPTHVHWITRNEMVHEQFVAGDTSSLSDFQLLDYPQCCAAWHYDCYFARGIEGFADVYVKDTSIEDIVAHLREVGWHQGSGWFLPSAYYLAGILRSNSVYPFVDHVACPDCQKRSSGPSGIINARNSDALEILDPQRHAKVLRYAENLPSRIGSLIGRPADAIDRETEKYDLSVRAKDAYIKHSRYLFKALCLGDRLPI